MKKIALIILSSVSLCSCNHYYYVANIQNIPLFRERNEYHLSAGYGFGDESGCFEIQNAYSLTDKVGILADFMHAKGGNISSGNYGKGSYFDAAIGYYKPMGSYGVFEVYGGLGGSVQHHEYKEDNRQYYSDLSFSKLFIQPSFGLTFKNFEVAGSSRFCRINYSKVEYDIQGNTNIIEELRDLKDKGHFFAEPAFTLRAGFKNIKFQVQAAYTVYLNSPRLYFAEEAHLSAGVVFVFAERFIKNKVESKNSNPH